MGFIDSYKKLDNLCKDLLNSDKGVTTYIEEMEKISNARFSVPNWEDDYKKLKKYRYIRNQIVHENDANEYNMCSTGDTEWIIQFHKRIMSTNDPLALYEKSTPHRHNNSQKKTLTNAKVTQSYTQYKVKKDDEEKSNNSTLKDMLFLIFMLIVIFSISYYFFR